MKIFKIIVTLCVLSLSSQASVFKVFDVLLNAAEFDKLMHTSGIMSRSVISQTKKNIKFSLEDLVDGGEASLSQLSKLKKHITGPKDKTKFEAMMKVFNKDKESVTRVELVDSINNLVFLSQRYGLKKRSILACAPCVNQELSQAGFKFTLNELKAGSSKKIFSIMKRKAKTPRDSIKFINSEVRKLKIGKNPRVLPHEEEALIYMLLVSKHGTSDQKSLYKAMLDVSKNQSGKVDIFDKTNGHKFFNLFANDLSASDINFWEDLLSDTAGVMKQEDMSTMDAFYSVLEGRAKNTSDQVEMDDLLSKLDYLKRQKCFSRK